VTASTAAPRPEVIIPSPLGELAALIGSGITGGSGDVSVTGVTLRTQDVRPGDLFAALPGTKAHGADFAERALVEGATALLTDPVGAGHRSVASANVPVLVVEDPRAVLGRLSARVYGDPTARLSVLGVTGTSGKTTVGFMV
jgi:UDP-N-acetylmuramoyl-L-alanyl-D-glutamate--2,6-diaminopimelate ligase